MLYVKNSLVMFDGENDTLCTDCALILNAVYCRLVEDYGKDTADKMLVKIGREAVNEELKETRTVLRDERREKEND